MALVNGGTGGGDVIPPQPSGTGTISDLTSNDGTITITDPTGPTTNLEITAPPPVQYFTNRGTVLYSTTYNPWDIVIYYGRRIVITTTFTTSAGTNGTGQPFISAANYVAINSLGIFYAADFGVVGDAVTDNWANMQNLMLLCWSLSTASGNGFKIFLPAGFMQLSKTLVLPPQVNLVGQGFYASTFRINAAANCDVMQTMVFNSSSQATLLGITAANLRNTFYAGLHDLCLHGNNTNQTFGAGYNYCLNITTNPLTTSAGSDPDFDPKNVFNNVYLRSATGDGLFASGRSGSRFHECVSYFNWGNGFTSSFDTAFTNCQSGFNGCAGWYINHGATQGAANKSYNNGDNAIWVANMSVTAGNLYYDQANTLICLCILSTATSATAPSTDPTHYVVLAETSPAAWGVGVYWDSNSGETTFQCDCQSNSGSSFYVHSITVNGFQINGHSSGSNFVNVSNGTNTAGVANTTNPFNYADLALDGCSGVVASLSISAGVAASYVLRVINGSTTNDVRVAGKTLGALLSADSTALAGSGNLVAWNGVLQSPAAVGIPTVPTAAGGTNTTQAASTAFVLANPAGTAQLLTRINPSTTGAIAAAVGDVVNTTAASTVTLPTGPTIGTCVLVNRGNHSALITITANTGQTINGGATAGSVTMVAAGATANVGQVLFIAQSATAWSAIALGTDINQGVNISGPLSIQGAATLASSMILHNTAKTATYSTANADIWIRCTANSFTVTLNGGTSQAQIVSNEGAGTITVAAASGSILGTSIIPPGGLAIYLRNGTNWVTAANYGCDLTQLAPTTVAGTAGNLTCSEPFIGSGYKKALVIVSATFVSVAGVTYTFPTPFTSTPVVTSGPIAGATVTVTTTGVTVAAASALGALAGICVEGT